MRKFLALAFALNLSVVAIGSPEPDRPTLEQDVVSQEVLSAYRSEMSIKITPSFDETILVNEKEAVFIDVGFGGKLEPVNVGLDIDDASLSQSILAVKGIGDIVIEEDSHKPFDRYKYPIWDYEPVAEPPSIGLFATDIYS